LGPPATELTIQKRKTDFTTAIPQRFSTHTHPIAESESAFGPKLIGPQHQRDYKHLTCCKYSCNHMLCAAYAIKERQSR